MYKRIYLTFLNRITAVRLKAQNGKYAVGKLMQSYFNNIRAIIYIVALDGESIDSRVLIVEIIALSKLAYVFRFASN